MKKILRIDGKDIEVKFVNDKYPILSFLYAVFAGGEAEINCDHHKEYMDAYLTSPGGRQFKELINAFLLPRIKEPKPVMPTKEDVEKALKLLKEELMQAEIPAMW